jgi:hypothetical protein
MYRRITKSTPILIAGAVLGVLCWPYVDDRAPRPKEVDATKALKSLVASLSPPHSPAPQRDPFDSRAAVRSGRRGRGRAGQTPEGTGSPAQTESAAAGTGTSLSRAPGELALQATHLRGDRRIALINGSVYAEGDEIKPTGPTATTYTVTRIYPHRVVLESASQTLELTYPAHDAKPNPGARGAAGEKPGRTKPARTTPRKTS